MERREQAISLLRQGLRVAVIAEITGYSKAMIYHLARVNQIHLYGLRLRDEDKRKIREMIEAGLYRNEIAREIGVSHETIKKFARDNGLTFEHDARLRNTEEYAISVIEKNAPAFEYIGGFVNAQTPVTVRCKQCGAVKQILMGTLSKSRHHPCETCKAMEQTESQTRRKAEKAEEKRVKRLQQKVETTERKQRLAEQRESERRHACPVCGQITTRLKYCSKVCANRAANRHRELLRRMKISSATIDKDITLEGVWRNDLGVCYICGCVCNWNDKTEKDGTIICGDTYPSIDHYIPLSKGGEHSWANTRLACRRCNSEKRDRVPAPVLARSRGRRAAGGGSHEYPPANLGKRGQIR